MRLTEQFDAGVRALPLGFRLLRTPGVPARLTVPLLFTLVIYGGTLMLTLPSLLDWIASLRDGAPGWVLEWFGWMITPVQFLLAALLVLLVGWVGVLVASTLASPFYGQIAGIIETRLTGRAPRTNRSLAAEIGAGLVREMQKLAWALPRFLAVLLLSFVPGVNVIAAPLSFLLGAWIMAVQFADFTPENNGLPFKETRATLARRRALTLGFGVPTAVGIGIPLVNLLVAPAAVAGGTALWLRASGAWDGFSGLKETAEPVAPSAR